MWTYLLAGAGFAFAAAVQPGPFQTWVVAETLRRGWRRTLPAAFAPLVSDAPILLICLVALNRIPSQFVRFLHFAGAAFLFTLAWGAYRSWRQPAAAASFGPGSTGGTLLKAALVNFLNPNPWLGWSLVMGPLFLTGYAEAPIRGIALIVGFYLTMVTCQIGLISLAASARQLGPGVVHWGLGLAVPALALFGFYQVWMGTRSLTG